MKIKRAIVKEIISNLAVFSLPFSIINVVFFIAYGRTNPVLWVLVVPFLFMFAFRKRVKDIYAFVTAHILLATVFGLIFWNYDARWFIVTFFVATGLFSCYLKTREEISLEKAFSATLIILFTGLFFLLTFAQATLESMQVQLIFMFLTAKCLSILFTHMDNVDYRMNVLAKVNGFKDPTGKIISINNALIMVFAGGVFIVGLLVAFGTNLLRYINLLGDVIVGLFRRFSEVLVRTMNYADIAGERFMQETAPEYLHIYTQIYMQLQAEHLEDVQHDQYALFESLQRTFNILSVFIFAAILVFLVAVLQIFPQKAGKSMGRGYYRHGS